MEPYFFYIFSFVTVFCVALMIWQKNPISSGLTLILSFFGLAVLYVMLEAHFVAVLQILVYAGAIMVLFVFVIMLLNLKKENLRFGRLEFFSVLTVACGSVLLYTMTHLFLKIPSVSFAKVDEGFGTAAFVGEMIFSKYVVAFEVIGLLLLVGVIGAVLLGRKEE